MKKSKIFLIFIIVSLCTSIFSYTIEEDERLTINYLVRNNKLTKAEKKLQAFIKRFPKRINFLFAAEIYVKLKKRNIAKKYWYKNVNNLLGEYVILEQIFFRYSLYEELETLYNKILAIQPGNLFIRIKLLKIYNATANLKKYFNNLILIIKRRKSFPYLLKKQILKTSLYYPDKSKKRIKNILLKLHLKAKIKIIFYEILNEIYFQQSNFKEYLKIVNILINKYDYSTSKLSNIVNRLSFIRTSKNIKKFFKKLANKYPTSIHLKSLIARYFYKNEEYEIVIKILEPSLKYLSNKNLFYFILGVCHFNSTNFNSSLKYLKMAKGAYLNNALFYQAVIMMKYGNLNIAEKLFNKTNLGLKYYYIFHLELFKKKKKHAFNILKKWLETSFEKAEAIYGFELLAIINQIKKNKNLFALYIKFMKLYFTNKFNSLFKVVAKIKQKSRYLSAYFSLKIGEHFIETKKYQKAEKYLKEVIIFKNFFSEKARFLLGKIYIKLNKNAKGKKILYKLLQEFPDTIYKMQIKKLFS